mgnify:CR=1 FL=1
MGAQRRRLLGEQQTVIKPLASIFAPLKALAGSTILGSGEVALVLDVPALVACATKARHGAEAAHVAIASHTDHPPLP